MSAVIQFRTMGGVIGLAIVTNVMNNYTRSRLRAILSPSQINSLLQTTQAFTRLPAEVVEPTKTVFAEGYNLQMRIMVGFAGAQVFATLLMWQKKQVTV